MVRTKAEQELEDLIVSKIVKLGCVCAVDLAGQIGGGMASNELIAPLESLVAQGILRHKHDKNDPREYGLHQRVYELNR